MSRFQNSDERDTQMIGCVNYNIRTTFTSENRKTYADSLFQYHGKISTDLFVAELVGEQSLFRLGICQSESRVRGVSAVGGSGGAGLSAARIAA